MAIGSFGQGATPAPVSEINTTPLVDVMLVLLVVMIVTAPLLAQAVKVDLPRVAAAPIDQKPDTVRLTLDAGGQLRWDDHPIGDADLAARLAAAAARNPQPELHLSADRSTRYEYVARAMGAARGAGIARLRFVTLPGESHGPAN